MAMTKDEHLEEGQEIVRQHQNHDGRMHAAIFIHRQGASDEVAMRSADSWLDAQNDAESDATRTKWTLAEAEDLPQPIAEEEGPIQAIYRRLEEEHPYWPGR